jgi:hypothetical protein
MIRASDRVARGSILMALAFCVACGRDQGVPDGAMPASTPQNIVTYAGCYRITLAEESESNQGRPLPARLPGLLQLHDDPAPLADYHMVALRTAAPGVYLQQAAIWRSSGDSLEIRYWNSGTDLVLRVARNGDGFVGSAYYADHLSPGTANSTVRLRPFVCIDSMSSDSAATSRFLGYQEVRRL